MSTGDWIDPVAHTVTVIKTDRAPAQMLYNYPSGIHTYSWDTYPGVPDHVEQIIRRDFRKWFAVDFETETVTKLVFDGDKWVETPDKTAEEVEDSPQMTLW